MVAFTRLEVGADIKANSSRESRKQVACNDDVDDEEEDDDDDGGQL